MFEEDIYGYIKSEEGKFNTQEIQVGDNWYWKFREHVQMIFHLANGVFFTGENNWLRAFKNIFEPMLHLSFWTEDIEVKDVVFFIEEVGGRVKSFLIKKYHDEVYSREHDLDKLFDDITESDLTYGGVVVQKGKNGPEVLPLQSIAFCDQTDLMGGPIGFKFNFSPEKLRSMPSAGWGNPKNNATISIEDLIMLADNQKSVNQALTPRKNKSTGKSIEVYIVRGSMPKDWIVDTENENDENDDVVVPQIQVIAFYKDAKGNDCGQTLYAKEDTGENLKFFSSSPVFGRALGRGVGEMLLPTQVWTNFLEIHKMNMLEAASKVPLYTDDPSYTQKNKIQDMENLEITTIEENRRIYQVPTAAPANLQLLEGAINSWYNQAQLAGAAFDPLLGKEPPSGTTFRGQERSVAQGRGIHDRRRGQRAKFIEEIYRDWIIPDMINEMGKGKTFLASLSLEDLNWIVDTVATNEANKEIIKQILAGKIITPDQQKAIVQVSREAFLKGGNRKLFEIVKGEMDDTEAKIGINIAAKQKNLANLSDKLLSIFQFVIANLQGFQSAMQIPALARSFSDILEFSGLSIADFSSLLQPVAQPQPEQVPQSIIQEKNPSIVLNQANG